MRNKDRIVKNSIIYLALALVLNIMTIADWLRALTFFNESFMAMAFLGTVLTALMILYEYLLICRAEDLISKL